MKNFLTITLVILFSTFLNARQRPDHYLIPSATALKGNGTFVYASGGGRLYQFNRQSGALKTLLVRRGSLYRYTFNKANSRFLCFYEGENFLHYLQYMRGRRVYRKLPLKKPNKWSEEVSTIFFDVTEKYAITYSAPYSNHVVAAVTSLTYPYRSRQVLARGGKIIYADLSHLVYMTYSGSRYGRAFKTNSEKVMYLNVKTGTSKVLHTFTQLVKRNIRQERRYRTEWYRSRVSAIPSKAKKRFALQIVDEHLGKNFFLVIDMKRSRVIRRFEAFAEFEGRRIKKRSAYMNPTDSFLAIHNIYYDRNDNYIKYSFLKESSDFLSNNFPFSRTRIGSYWAYGYLSDGKTLWHHPRGKNYMVLIDTESRKYSITNMLTFARKQKVEWGGLTYFFSSPDEFYAGIEKGGGRYYIRFPLSKLRPPVRPMPAGINPLDFMKKTALVR